MWAHLPLFLLPLSAALLREASSIIPHKGDCKPGELVWVDCNLCTCNPQGRPNIVCAKMWCQPQPKGKSGNDRPSQHSHLGGNIDLLPEDDEEVLEEGDEDVNDHPLVDYKRD